MIDFRPAESIGKSAQQIQDCAEFIFNHGSQMKAALTESIKAKQDFKMIEKPFDSKEKKYPFFFKPQPILSFTTTNHAEITEPPKKIHNTF